MIKRGRDFHNPRLIFPVVADNTPSGGRKFIYHVVDFLNEAGFDAWVAHPFKNFRLTWFKNNTQVGYAPELFPKLTTNGFKSVVKYLIRKYRCCILKAPSGNTMRLSLRGSDIIVVPETRLGILGEMPIQCRKIILNQNPYLMFAQNFSHIRPSTDLFGRDVLGMIVLSKLNHKIQKFIFTNTRIVEAQLFIEEKFHYQEFKKLQIAYMPRRRAEDASAVLNMLRFRGVDIPVIQIEIGSVMKKSLIFCESP